MRAARLIPLLVPVHVAAQDVTPVSVPNAPSCPGCRIVVATAASLGDADGPGEITTLPASVRIDGRGRYWVWGGNMEGGPLIYDRNGQFLKQAGRKGQGPGEFEMVTDVVPLPGDSVLVMDYQRRATIFRPDLTIARFIPLDAALSQSVAVAWPSAIIGFSHYAAGGRGGPVLHRMTFDSSARVVQSFGPSWSLPDLKTMMTAMRAIAPSSSGIWTASQEQYRIEHWSPQGQLQRVFERTPAWPQRTTEGLGTPTIAPPNSVQAITEDRAGRLWVFISVAAPTWREGWPANIRGEMSISSIAFEKVLRTLVEVIDPVAGRVVARQQLDEYVIAALPGARAAIYSVGADDIIRVRIVQFTLEGTSRP